MGKRARVAMRKREIASIKTYTYRDLMHSSSAINFHVCKFLHASMWFSTDCQSAAQYDQ